MNDSATPTPKVAAAGIGGAAATVIVWIVNAATGVEVPGEVGAAIGAIAAFIAGYLKSP